MWGAVAQRSVARVHELLDPVLQPIAVAESAFYEERVEIAVALESDYLAVTERDAYPRTWPPGRSSTERSCAHPRRAPARILAALDAAPDPR
jgi:hypothetical protein